MRIPDEVKDLRAKIRAAEQADKPELRRQAQGKQRQYQAAMPRDTITEKLKNRKTPCNKHNLYNITSVRAINTTGVCGKCEDPDI